MGLPPSIKLAVKPEPLFSLTEMDGSLQAGDLADCENCGSNEIHPENCSALGHNGGLSYCE
jgi:hypothetical protein